MLNTLQFMSVKKRVYVLIFAYKILETLVNTKICDVVTVRQIHSHYTYICRIF